MPSRLRRLTGRELLAILHSIGFEVVATRGSHARLRRQGPAGEAQVLTVPLHKELALGTLRAIYRQACRFAPEEQLRPLFFHE